MIMCRSVKIPASVAGAGKTDGMDWMAGAATLPGLSVFALADYSRCWQFGSPFFLPCP